MYSFKCFHFRFFVLLVVYFVAGAVFLKFRRGAEGVEIIPNVEFWKSLPGLIRVSSLWARGYKTFLSSAQLIMKYVMLINVKMPTIVGILTFIRKINTIPESLKARKVSISPHFSFYEQLKFHDQSS